MNAETLMIRYLLGALSETEQTQFEEKYFSDDQVFEELQIVEADLIDSYVRGELTEFERRQFETCYLNSPERRRKVENARCLMAALADTSRPKPVTVKKKSVWDSILQGLAPVFSPMRFAYAAAAVAVLAFAFITLEQNRGLRWELSRVRSEADILKRSNELEQQVARSVGSAGRGGPGESPEEIAQLHPPESLTASINLSPGVSRGTHEGTSHRLVVPQTARLVVINLLLESDEYRRGYTALVENANGDEIARVDRLKSRPGTSRGKVVEVEMPADLLGSDTYIVKLVGVTTQGGQEDVEEYSFQVVRR